VLLLSLVLAAGLTACDNMANQPKRVPYEVYSNEPSPPPPRQEPQGTVARDDEPEPAPPPVTMAMLERGHERYDIFCSVCHGPAGDGDGQIVQRGFPAPPSYHSERLREISNQHLYDVITQGYGVMFSYAQRVPPADRWAIIAYIRALQASQHVPVGELSAAERAELP
jgi:mono/diheme cytochrome c family protein